jgi:hypothetical protein
VAILRALLRIPFVQLRLFVHTPSAHWPVIALASLIGLAWAQTIRPGAGPGYKRALEWSVFACAAAALLWFFHAGRFAWDQNRDWQKEWTYFQAWKDATRRGELPFYLHTQVQGTERFLANLETIVAPHVILLGVMSTGSFFMLHVTVFFAMGHIALVALRHELGLSPFVWVVFVTLFIFNGHITAHLGVGHTQWVSYFLIPWVFLCVVRASRADYSTRNAATLAVTLAAMIMIGGWHVFVWSALFLVFFSLSSLARLAWLARTSLMVVLLAAFRLLPALVTFGGGTNVFLGSFRNVWTLCDALVGGPGSWRDGLDPWEYDTYIGHVGFAVLCLGAIPIRKPSNRSVNALLAPAFALLILAMDGVYQHTMFRLPGFVSERVVTRLAIIPVLALVLSGCVRVGGWRMWQRRGPGVRSVSCLLAAWLLAAQLALRAQGARPSTAGIGLPLATDALKEVAVEASYLWSVYAGAAVSTATLLLLAVMVSRHAPRPRSV